MICGTTYGNTHIFSTDGLQIFERWFWAQGAGERRFYWQWDHRNWVIWIYALLGMSVINVLCEWRAETVYVTWGLAASRSFSTSIASEVKTAQHFTMHRDDGRWKPSSKYIFHVSVSSTLGNFAYIRIVYSHWYWLSPTNSPEWCALCSYPINRIKYFFFWLFCWLIYLEMLFGVNHRLELCFVLLRPTSNATNIWCVRICLFLYRNPCSSSSNFSIPRGDNCGHI